MKTAITNITIVLAIIMLLSHPARGQNKKKALEPESKLSKKNGTMKPVIFPVVETEEPQLYFKGIKNIKFSLIKYKDSLLDILTEANFDPGKINKKIFLDKNQIKKENTHHYQWNTSAPGSLPLALSNKRKSPLNETTFDQGLFAFRIHHLELWDKGDEAATKKYVSTIASKLKVFYKKEIDFVVRGNSKTFLVWVFNSKTRKGIQGAGVVLVRKTGETTASKKNEIGRTNRDGVCYGNLQAKSGDMIVVNDPQTRQKAFYMIREDDDSHFHANPEEKEVFRAEVFADREHYQPGSTIHIGGVVKRVRNGRIKNPRIPGVTFVIENPSDIEVKRENVQLNELGGFRTSYQPGTNCEKGKYTFHIKHGDWKQEFYPVLVDNYQPGAVRLELSEDKKVYGKNDTFAPLTAGRYLSGKTMAGDKPDYVFRFGRGHTLYPRGLRKEYSFGLDETFKVDWDKYKPVEGEGT
ncbi:MAG: hypothetical protein GY757_42745, partial [bacterium]|nr:hypothetical protein [bacterium]